MVLTFQLIIEILQLQLIDKVADVLFVHVVQVPQVQVVILTCFPQFLVQVVETTVEFPQLPRDPHDKSLTCPLLSTTDDRWFRQCRKLWRFMALTIEISQLQYI